MIDSALAMRIGSPSATSTHPTASASHTAVGSWAVGSLAAGSLPAGSSLASPPSELHAARASMSTTKIALNRMNFCIRFSSSSGSLGARRVR